VSWLGTTSGMENALVPPTGIALDRIAFSGLRGKGLLHTHRRSAPAQGFLGLPADPAPARRERGARHGRLRLLSRRHDGRPAGQAAVLVNADAALLLSNRALLPVADRVAFGFDGADAKKTKRAVVTGNPVRAEIEALPAPAARFAGRSGPLRLLVVGGSLGAQVLNQTVPARWR
jgi:UDP-N-acetylglucosamine--N-acetylmuramyl-(pentapeptide) pyrophosphoryl-undecaprenol N-acetylglucosamine transferase